MSENFESFNVNFKVSRPPINTSTSNRSTTNQRINILSRKINNKIGGDLFKEIKDKDIKAKEQLKKIKTKMVEKNFNKNMEGVGRGLMEDLKRTDESILEIKKYKDFRFNKEENIYIPGVEQITKLKPVKIPDYLGFTKEEYYMEKYGKELTKYCREVLGLSLSLYETLDNIKDEESLDSINKEDKLKTLYYRDPYYLMLKSFRKGELDVNAFNRPISMKDDKKHDHKKDKKHDKKHQGKKQDGGKKKKGKGDGKGEKQGNQIENTLKYILTVELGGDVSEVQKYLEKYKDLNTKIALNYRAKIDEKIKEWVGNDVYEEMVKHFPLNEKEKIEIYGENYDYIDNIFMNEKPSANEDGPFQNGLIEGYKKLVNDDIFYDILEGLVNGKKQIYDFNTGMYRQLNEGGKDKKGKHKKEKIKIKIEIPNEDDSGECMFVFLYYLLDEYRKFYNPQSFKINKAPSVMDSAINRNSIMKLVLVGVEVYLFQLRKSFLDLVDFIRRELVSNKTKLLSENDKKKREKEELMKIRNDVNKKISEQNSEEKKKRLMKIKEKINDKIKKLNNKNVKSNI